jgi:hypothetical protein
MSIGKLSRPQMRVDEVDRENKQDSQQRFFAMHHQDRVQRPARQKPREEWRKPHRIS